ncbi:putative transcriptional regulator [Cupriavidus necator]|uniref:Putative transcriptional regulator n=1 Tax=Cupriavidus necator TaxID=106590 RepID=A0A1U9UKK2_CUPNE|nr:helix-turn-helix transcriptional regulator [Cupriavidus necator]AQV93202.1 putative transcriptional regulator [Cupriavidus necator]
MVNKDEKASFQIARRVRELREGAGLSQDGLARLLPSHRSLVSQVERAANNLSVDTIQRFAIALGVDAVSLLRKGPPIACDPNDRRSLRERISQNVFSIRTAKGLPQEGLSESAGLSRNYVATLEVHKKNVALDHLEKLALGLGVPISTLFEPNRQD